MGGNSYFTKSRKGIVNNGSLLAAVPGQLARPVFSDIRDELHTSTCHMTVVCVARPDSDQEADDGTCFTI